MDTSVESLTARDVVRRDVSMRAWIARCAAAEAIGMTAAAAAARYTDHVLNDRSTLTIALAGTCILLAGLVEGTALGIAQAGALRRLLQICRSAAMSWSPWPWPESAGPLARFPA